MNALATFNPFYNQILKNARNEIEMKNTRPFCVANTYNNESEFQQVENLSRNYVRSGIQQFADPFAFHPKPYNWYFEGRKLDVQNTLEYNQVQNYPEFISQNNLRVVGRY